MQTRDMTAGDLMYRLVQGRDPPWNNDTAKNTVGRMFYARPTLLIEWLHALNPLKIHFCRCGRLHEIWWERAYFAKHLYPKGPIFTTGMCAACTKVHEMFRKLDDLHVEPEAPAAS